MNARRATSSSRPWQIASTVQNRHGGIAPVGASCATNAAFLRCADHDVVGMDRVGAAGSWCYTSTLYRRRFHDQTPSTKRQPARTQSGRRGLAKVCDAVLVWWRLPAWGQPSRLAAVERRIRSVRKTPGQRRRSSDLAQRFPPKPTVQRNQQTPVTPKLHLPSSRSSSGARRH